MKTKAKGGADFKKKLELETGIPLGLSNHMAVLVSFSTQFFLAHPKLQSVCYTVLAMYTNQVTLL